MTFYRWIVDFILHADVYLTSFIQHYGSLTYLFLFFIIFLETGLIITPFLPGDSLLFVAGTLAAQNVLNIFSLFFLLTGAAILGDTVNYAIGRYFGENVFSRSRFFKKEYLERTKFFYQKHGGKTIILARFIPIIRTFAPFVAGVGMMAYKRFLLFNVLGAVLWVTLFLFGGYFFGGLPFVQEHLTLVVFLIIFVSFLPPLFEYLRHQLH